MPSGGCDSTGPSNTSSFRSKPCIHLDRSTALTSAPCPHTHGLTLRRQQGVAGNFVDVDTGNECWLSGPKRDRTDARFTAPSNPAVDDDVQAEYQAFLGGAPLPAARTASGPKIFTPPEVVYRSSDVAERCRRGVQVPPGLPHLAPNWSVIAGRADIRPVATPGRLAHERGLARDFP